MDILSFVLYAFIAFLSFIFLSTCVIANSFGMNEFINFLIPNKKKCKELERKIQEYERDSEFQKALIVTFLSKLIKPENTNSNSNKS